MSELILGYDYFKKDKPVTWAPDSKDVVNPHLSIMGASGTGKTTLLRKVIEYLSSRGYNIIIIDFHGDIKTNSEEVFKYDATNSKYGLSLFDFDPDPEKGGVQSRVLEIVKSCKKSFLPNMGPLQEATLKQLMFDLYKTKGINHTDPTTWNTKAIPTVGELLALMEEIETYVSTGMQKEFFDMLKKARTISIKNDNEEELGKKLDKIETELLKKLNTYFDLLRNSATAVPPLLNDLDINFYENKNVLKSMETLKIYIKDLVSSGIFTAPSPKPSKKVIRFDLSGLNEHLQFFLSDAIIQRIFRKSKRKKPDNKPKTFIVIDESKLVLPTGKEKENPFNFLNRIVSESRKFGLGIILVSQRIAHYSEEMLSNIDTKILLRIHENDIKAAKTKLGIKEDVYFRHLASRFGVAIVRKGGSVASILLDNASSS